LDVLLYNLLKKPNNILGKMYMVRHRQAFQQVSNNY